MRFFRHLLQRVRGRLNHFARDDSASVLIMAALAMVPLTILVGFLIDAARVQIVKTKLAGALDAAALAGGQYLGETFVADEVEEYLNINFPDGYLGTTRGLPTVSVDLTERTLTADLVAQVETPFMSSFGVTDVDVVLTSTVIGDTQNVELAMVLDISSSMNVSNRIDTLRTASLDLVNGLFGATVVSDTTAISIVPFAIGVRLGQEYNSWFSTPPETTDYTGAPISDYGRSPNLRTAPLDTSQENPSSGLFEEYWFMTPRYQYYTLFMIEEEIMPLNNNRDTLIARINQLDAGGGSRPDMGMVWGWRSISPQYRGLWFTSEATMPVNYGEAGTEKVAILMTDAGSVDETTNSAELEAQTRLLDICAAMRGQSIKIYTIAFLASGAGQTVLEDCAGDAANAFTADTNEDLEAAFRQITLLLTRLRILK